MNLTDLRIGHGFDLHRLEPQAPNGKGGPFVLGGIHFEHDRGPVGHSDGDAALHAITDALLGALGARDIGQLFPNNDPRNRDRDSMVFLIRAGELVREAKMEIVNIDVTIICERPKLSNRKGEMISRIAEGLKVEEARVNVKGKTHEQVDAIGEGRALEVHAVTLLAPANS